MKFCHDVDSVISFPTVYCTSKSMQPFRKYSRLKIVHLRQSKGFTKISVKSVIMHRFRKIFHWCLPDICANNFASESFWSEELHPRVLSFESGKTHFFAFFSCFRPPKWEEGVKFGGWFWCRWNAHTNFCNSCPSKSFRYLRPFSHKSTKHSEKTRFSSGGSLRR